MGAGVKLRERLARAVAAFSGKDSGFPGVSPYLWGFPFNFDQNDLEYPKAVAMIATVNACVTRISQDLAGVPIRFYTRKGDKYTPLPDSHPLPMLMEKGNPEASGYDVMEGWTANAETSGRSYLFLERGRSGKLEPFEVWSFPSHLLHPIPGPHRRVVEYQDLRTRETYPASSIVPLNKWNPNWNPLEPSPSGLSPLSAAQLSYEMLHQQQRFMRKFFETGGDVNLWLRPLDKDRQVTPAEKKTIREALEEHAGGIKNIGRPKILSGMEIVRPGMNLQEMQFTDVSGQADLAICRVYQVPPVILGIKDGGGLSDAGATTDLLLYCMNCLEPRAKKISAALTKFLCPIWGEDIVAELDLTGMLPIQNARLDQAKTLQVLTGRPVITADEARDQLDYDKAPNGTGDELVVPYTVTLASDLTNPPEPAPANPAASPATPPADAKPSDAAPVAASRVARMTDSARERLRRSKDVDLRRYERRTAAWARGRFSRQEDHAIAVLESRGVRASRLLRAAYDPSELVPEDNGADEAQRMFEALIADRAEAAAIEVASEVALNVYQGTISHLIQNRAAQFVTNIDDTTRARLAEILAELSAEGASFDDLVRAVRQVFSDRRANAATIARTETAWAYNLASVETWKAAGVTLKSWLTVGDDAVRDSHRECESSGVLGMSEMFPNGLQYPGDPSGPPDETINCRCVLQPEFDDATLRRVASRNGHSQSLEHFFNGAAK